MRAKCVWCLAEDVVDLDRYVEVDDPDPELLCRPHLAEYEGLSVSELDRMESEQYAEYADTLG